MAKAEIVYFREQNAQLQSQIQSLSANMADTMEGDGSGMLDDRAKLVSRELAQQHKVREFHGHHDKEDFGEWSFLFSSQMYRGLTPMSFPFIYLDLWYGELMGRYGAYLWGRLWGMKGAVVWDLWGS